MNIYKRFKKIFVSDKKEIILVTPPSPYYPVYRRLPYPPYSQVSVVPLNPLIPLGVASIGASLEKEGFDVKIVDLTFVNKQQYNADRVKEIIMKYEPEVVGISSFTATIPATFKLAKALKEESSSPMVIFGGAHVSALPLRTLKECQSIDATIIGEGDYVFPHFLKILFENGMSSELSNLKGVMIRHNKQILGDPSPVYVNDVDSLPFPARHLFNLKHYAALSQHFTAKNHPVASIITSRGCPFSCIFCARSNSGRRYRARSPENVVRELENLKGLGFNEVQIVDDTFTLDRLRVLKICELIKEKGLEMSFSLPNGTRTDSVDEELLSNMYDAGFYSIRFGVESADDGVLKTIKKGTTSEQNRRAISLAKKIGYEVGLYAIIGLPGSSLEAEEKTLQFVKDVEADSATFSICTPYPGSELWEITKDRLEGVSWDKFNEADISNPLYIPEGMTKDELLNYIEYVKDISEEGYLELAF